MLHEQAARMTIAAVSPRSHQPLHFFQLRDDHLEPAVRRLDYLLLAETSVYVGEGIYVVSQGRAFEPAAYHVTGFGPTSARPILMRIPNNLYRGEGQSLSRAEFSRIVVGKAVMTCQVQDHSLIDHFAERHRTAA